MTEVTLLAQAKFENSEGDKCELTQYSDGTCTIRVTETSFIVLSNPLARCIAATLAEMAGE